MSNQHELTPEQIQFRTQLKSLKNDIKQLSAEQREMKRQRKTVHFTGERTLEPWQAVSRVVTNANKLRHMFILYGEIRNKPCSYADKANTLILQTMRDKYFPEPFEPIGSNYVPLPVMATK